MLTLNKLSISCNTKTLLNAVSFSILPSSLTFIIGENSTGKTSLLKTIASIKAPDSGYITFNECDTTQNEYSYSHLCSYVDAQHHALYNNFSVERNLLWLADLNKTHLCLEATIHTLELEHFLNMKFKQLSTGIKRRVSLARLMLERTKIWLLDEPFSNLDEKGCTMISNLINAKCQSRGYVIIAQPFIPSALLFKENKYQTIYLKDYNDKNHIANTYYTGFNSL